MYQIVVDVPKIVGKIPVSTQMLAKARQNMSAGFANRASITPCTRKFVGNT